MAKRLPLNRIFVGDIMKCVQVYSKDTRVNDAIITEIVRPFQLFKENAILFQRMNGNYTDIEKMDFWLGFGDLELSSAGSLEMGTMPSEKGSLFVDESSLRPYVEMKDQIEEKRLIKVKRFLS